MFAHGRVSAAWLGATTSREQARTRGHLLPHGLLTSRRNSMAGASGALCVVLCHRVVENNKRCGKSTPAHHRQFGRRRLSFLISCHRQPGSRRHPSVICLSLWRLRGVRRLLNLSGQGGASRMVAWLQAQISNRQDIRLNSKRSRAKGAFISRRHQRTFTCASGRIVLSSSSDRFRSASL